MSAHILDAFSDDSYETFSLPLIGLGIAIVELTCVTFVAEFLCEIPKELGRTDLKSKLPS